MWNNLKSALRTMVLPTVSLYGTTEVQRNNSLQDVVYDQKGLKIQRKVSKASGKDTQVVKRFLLQSVHGDVMVRR